ncbi:MAG: host attachment protein [Hyphomonadaceae bacterium]|nr:host attachment protein [Hyphomonadaceae bacterium]
MTAPLTWIVTADGGAARFFERLRPGADLTEKTDIAMRATPPAQPRDRLPRAQESATPARHSIEPRTSPRTASETHFLRGVAQLINASAESGAFDALIVCAPPRALGILRDLLGSAAAQRLRQTIAKDFIHDSAKQLERHLEGSLP